jgi:hypothetical protein
MKPRRVTLRSKLWFTGRIFSLSGLRDKFHFKPARRFFGEFHLVFAGK